MPGAVGTSCKLRYWLGPDVGHEPEPGDLIRTEPRGTCYLVDAVRRCPDDPRRPGVHLALTVTRLGKDAVGADDDGVWPFYWERRRR
jgi:hypothetical protein